MPLDARLWTTSLHLPLSLYTEISQLSTPSDQAMTFADLSAVCRPAPANASYMQRDAWGVSVNMHTHTHTLTCLVFLARRCILELRDLARGAAWDRDQAAENTQTPPTGLIFASASSVK